MKTPRALFIGRFQPFHNGHLHAIRQVVKKYGRVTIGIGSSDASRTRDNPFTLVERRKLLAAGLAGERGLKGKFSVVALPDFFDNLKWRRNVTSKVDFEVVVTGSAWVSRCLAPVARVERPDFLRRAELNATRIRRFMRSGSREWKKLVPNAVLKVLEKISGVEVVKASA